MGKAPKQWTDERSLLAAIVDSSFDAIIGKSLDGVIKSWNKGAESVYGYSKEEAINLPIAIIIPTTLDNEEPEILDVLKSGRRLEFFETTRRRKDGRLIDVSITVSPIFNEGKIIGSATIERDITQRKRIERDLVSAKERAEEANRTKSEFLANVSHELRTPMNAIIGMTELALQEELSEQVQDYIETANVAAHTLHTLLNDLLDFSRMEAGRFDLASETFHLNDVFDEVIRTLSVSAHEKGLELGCDVARRTPRWLVGDSRRLKQVVLNLTGNAVKFTQQGEVIVHVDVVDKSDGEVQLKIDVRDTGIGISADDQKRIFAPFAQADASTTREYSGSGLGLAISAELIAQMGGEISVRSQPGRGSTFTCTPRFKIGRPSRGPTQSESQADQFRGLPVLVVDDNESNRKILREMLENWHMRPTVLQSADDALEELRRVKNCGDKYPLAIVDALMPKTDGFELLERAESDELLTGASIVMISSADRKLFEPRVQDAPIAAFLEKPVTQSDLLDSIIAAIHGDEPTPSGPQPAAPAPYRLRVLLAEDQPANQKVVQSILKKRGHEVATAHNGRDAVELIKESDFDVVLMDVQMPTMDGFQATAAVRNLERNADVPIVAITAHAMKSDRERCFAAGMDAYIPKPIDARRLVRIVEQVAKTKAKPPPSLARNEESPGQSSGVFDRQAAVKRLGDETLFFEMIHLFNEDAPPLLEEIESGLRSEDSRKVMRAAHSLAGLAANFEAQFVVQTARRIEESAESDQWNRARAAFPQLRQRTAELQTALETHQ